MEIDEFCTEESESVNLTEYLKYVDTSLSERFEDALSKGLKWIPWIGKDYAQTPTKVLIVAGAHGWDAERSELINPRKDATQYFIWESRIGAYKFIRRYNNIEYTLAGTRYGIDRTRLWSHLAFYNFIQRPMRSKNDKPGDEDYELGWEHFIRVVRALQPDVCLFCSSTSHYSFEPKMQAMQVQYEPLRLTNAHAHNIARATSLKIDDRDVRLIFMSNSAKFFSWLSWHTYLQREIPQTMRYFHVLHKGDEFRLTPFHF